MQNTKSEPTNVLSYKYTIRDHMDQIPKGDYADSMGMLLEKLNISKSQLYRIMNIPKDSSRSATSDQLLTIAEFFDCQIDDLINKS